MIPAVILAGGKGTRIRSIYSDRPKVLVPVYGKPILQWQLELLIRQDITRIILAAGYMAETLYDWLNTVGRQTSDDSFLAAHGDKAATVTVATEPAPLGTGGAFKFIEPLLAESPLLLGINGDSLLPELHIAKMVASHLALFGNKKVPIIGRLEELKFQSLEDLSAGGSLAVAPIEQAGRYGTVAFDHTHRITAFREKADHSAGMINGGVYLLHRDLLQDITSGQKISIEEELFPGWAEQQRLAAFECAPPLLDMGTPEGLQAMTDYLQSRH